jgi:hypothetical protein
VAFAAEYSFFNFPRTSLFSTSKLYIEVYILMGGCWSSISATPCILLFKISMILNQKYTIFLLMDCGKLISCMILLWIEEERINTSPVRTNIHLNTIILQACKFYEICRSLIIAYGFICCIFINPCVESRSNTLLNHTNLIV